MAGLLAQMGLGNFNFGTLSLITSLFIALFFIILVFGALGGLIIFIVWNKSYNQTVKLWGRVGGIPQEITTYRAKWIKIAGPHSNDRLMFVRKVGRWELPKLMSKRNTWFFWRREQDGEWINFLPEDLDEKFKTLNIKFIDGDMRTQRVANEKVLRDRLQKKKNWMEIIAQVGYIIVFLFLIMGLVILFSQLKSLSVTMEQTAQSIQAMATSVNNFYQSKGGVLVPANNQRPPVAFLPLLGGVY